ncbi:hypothetical protein HaLaN_10444 [Haematococcus lacustris]|uniref:Uncharacterized protein n=1 Tax=Haematococcus lacustris TaxID=44745 RepID=A0A699Z4W8_HAELA|nr:hypothetical protein HaLaN_10444 [Haematococcus lacustris]
MRCTYSLLDAASLASTQVTLAEQASRSVMSCTASGHPRHWPRNSLFGSIFDPLRVILPPLSSVSHSGVASRRGGLVAGGSSVSRSLCCRSAPNPHQPEALPSSSPARQSAVENCELEPIDAAVPAAQPAAALIARPLAS